MKKTYVSKKKNDLVNTSRKKAKIEAWKHFINCESWLLIIIVMLVGGSAQPRNVKEMGIICLASVVIYAILSLIILVIPLPKSKESIIVAFPYWTNQPVHVFYDNKPMEGTIEFIEIANNKILYHVLLAEYKENESCIPLPFEEKQIFSTKGEVLEYIFKL